VDGRKRAGNVARRLRSHSKTPARAYPPIRSTQALHIEPRDYQQAALDAWIDHDRRGSVVLPTGSGKTFLGLQAIADAGVSTPS